ncbi:MAG: DUF5916 domain-containing protein, partial [Verrucomicrobiota bacterium]
DRAVIAAIRVEQGPRLDGIIDDPCWRSAPPLTNFTQVLPVEGATPSERTEVRFVYDRDDLYIAVRCFDDAPGRIIAKQMQRDNAFDSDDFVTVAFDTFDRQHDGYFFAVNPVGARTDGLIQNFSDRKYEWDGIWDARARVDELGWTVEFVIPLKSLSFDPAHDTWGCNVERIIRRKQETVRWSVLSRAKPATTLSDFGELRGLVGLRQGLGLEVRPFVSVKYLNDGATGNQDWKLKPGADATYHLTPSLTANATVNTDFAEAEVDDRIVNLTRFPVSFPEKRDFFLQDSSLFSFGGLNSSFNPYYSRRIGLTADGQPVDILAGGRLTGRVGNMQVALLDVQQDSYSGVPSKNLFVGRFSTKVLDESNVGLITTHGDPRNPGDNTLAGFDFNYLDSRLPAQKQLVGHAWVMGTDSDNVHDQAAAFGGTLNFPNEPLSARIQARQIGDDFDPAIGFVTLRGIRDYEGDSEYIWRPNAKYLRSYSIATEWEFFTDLHNRVINQDNDICTINFTSPAGDSLELQYGNDEDVLDTADAIEHVTIPAGDYWDGHVTVAIDTSQARPFSAGFIYRNGGFYNGDKQDYTTSVSWRPSRYLTTSAEYQLSRIHHLGAAPGADFDVHVVTYRLNLCFTPDLTWLTLVQYDNDSDNFAANSRVRWTWRPGNDLFFVVNQGWLFDEWRFDRQQTEIALKVGVTFRF